MTLQDVGSVGAWIGAIGTVRHGKHRNRVQPRSSLVRAALIALVSVASSANAFDIHIEGSTPPGAGVFAELEFSGAVFIDLDEPISFVGDRRGFFLIPVGTFTLDLGPFGVSEPISAVRFVNPGSGAPSELTIEAFPAEDSLERVTLSVTPEGEGDPLASGSLSGALEALADACCSASITFQPVGGPPITTSVDSLEAVPEAPAPISLGLGAVVLLLAGSAVRKKRDSAGPL